MGIYDVGQMVAGRYRILSPLSQGGMGAVYLADQVSLGREVALKVILNRRAGADAESRFDAEARAVCQLRHPNIITYHDYGRDEQGRPFLVMEFLPGYDGTKLVYGERMPSLTDVVHVVGQVCSALHEAHTKGIIHRDLKWSNVMIVPQSHDPLFTKLIDFGILKVATDGSSGDQRRELTRTGVLLGTPQYMSPEAICGQTIDGRADIYSLGVMTWEMLCGHRPFKSDSHLELLRMHVQEPRPGMDVIRSLLVDAPALEPTVIRAMAQQPAERFQTALDFHAALAEAVGLPGPSRTTPAKRSRAANAPTPYQRPRPANATPDTPHATPYSGRPPTHDTAPRAPASQVDSTPLPPYGRSPMTPTAPPPDVQHRPGLPPVSAAAPETGVPLGSDVYPPTLAPRGSPTPGWVWALGAFAVALAGFVIVLLMTSTGPDTDGIASSPLPETASVVGGRDPRTPELVAADQAAAEKAAADTLAAEAEAAQGVAAEKAAADKAEEDKAAADKAAADKAAADKAAADKAAADKAAAIRARQPRYGKLTVSARPYATVRINGRNRGGTPLKDLRVKAGTVKVTLEHPTYGRKTRTIRLGADETKRLFVQMNE